MSIPNSSHKTSTPENVSCDQIYFCCKTFYIGTIGHNNCKRPTYYTMITLFDQNRKYYNQKNKILHLVSHKALQTAPLIDTMETLNSVTVSSDKYAQLLAMGNCDCMLK